MQPISQFILVKLVSEDVNQPVTDILRAGHPNTLQFLPPLGTIQHRVSVLAEGEVVHGTGGGQLESFFDKLEGEKRIIAQAIGYIDFIRSSMLASFPGNY